MACSNLSAVYLQIESAATSFAVLDVDSRSTKAEIRDKYRALALIIHPDKATSLQSKDLHTALFQIVQIAYEDLQRDSAAHDTDATRDAPDVDFEHVQARNRAYWQSRQAEREKAFKAKRKADAAKQDRSHRFTSAGHRSWTEKAMSNPKNGKAKSKAARERASRLSKERRARVKAERKAAAEDFLGPARRRPRGPDFFRDSDVGTEDEERKYEESEYQESECEESEDEWTTEEESEMMVFEQTLAAACRTQEEIWLEDEGGSALAGVKFLRGKSLENLLRASGLRAEASYAEMPEVCTDSPTIFDRDLYHYSEKLISRAELYAKLQAGPLERRSERRWTKLHSPKEERKRWELGPNTNLRNRPTARTALSVDDAQRDFVVVTKADAQHSWEKQLRGGGTAGCISPKMKEQRENNAAARGHRLVLAACAKADRLIASGITGSGMAGASEVERYLYDAFVTTEEIANATTDLALARTPGAVLEKRWLPDRSLKSLG